MKATEPLIPIKGTILAIDDNSNVLELVRRGLARRGYHVVTTTHGNHALRLLPQIQPDLILCDVSMPEVDGYEVLERVQANSEWRSIPFVFLTAFAKNEHVRKGMVAGAHDYLTKPFSIKELEATIETQLNRVQQQREQVQAELDELRGKIAHSLPHELRTPLHIIKGYSALLMDEIEEETQSLQADMLNSIQAYTDRMHHIIENFLLYSQLMLKPESVTEDMIAFDSVSEAIAEEATTIARQYRREDDLELKLQPTHLKINPLHLYKIIQEVLDNAFKFSEADAPVQLITSQIGDAYHIYITDEGRGLTAKQLQNIGAYMQFDRHRYEQQGTGLGLAIARLLTEAYGGSLKLKSKVGEGTKVQIILKVSEVSARV